MLRANSELEYAGRHEDLLDLICTLTVIGFAITCTLSTYRSTIEHVKVVEAQTLMTGAIVELHEYRAMNGSWPIRSAWLPSGVRDEEGLPAGQYVNEVTAAAGGSLNFVMDRLATRGPGQLLSIRGATMPGVAGSPVVWVCGYAAVPPGFESEAANMTDIDAAQLPAACRGSLQPLAASR